LESICQLINVATAHIFLKTVPGSMASLKTNSAFYACREEIALSLSACYFCCINPGIDDSHASNRSAIMSVTSKIRRQGGAAVITIPPTLLKLLHLEVGAQLELNVVDGELIARPAVAATRKRYSLSELLEGAEELQKLNAQTSETLEGDSVGRELG
jgi:antitoxin ChpS